MDLYHSVHTGWRQAASFAGIFGHFLLLWLSPVCWSFQTGLGSDVRKVLRREREREKKVRDERKRERERK
jgi:hypothetical protein